MTAGLTLDLFVERKLTGSNRWGFSFNLTGPRVYEDTIVLQPMELQFQPNARPRVYEDTIVL